MCEKNVALPATGMMCANCAQNIKRNGKKLPEAQEAIKAIASEVNPLRFHTGHSKRVNIDEVVAEVWPEEKSS